MDEVEPNAEALADIHQTLVAILLLLDDHQKDLAEIQTWLQLINQRLNRHPRRIISDQDVRK